jgi:hypothetical protein
MSDLQAQVQAEAAQLQQAPQQPIAAFQPKALGQQGRCGWCGQWANDLVQVEQGRYKGVHCCGGRHL